MILKRVRNHVFPFFTMYNIMGQAQNLNLVTCLAVRVFMVVMQKPFPQVWSLFILFGFGSEATVYEHSDWSMRAPALETSARMSYEQDYCRLAASASMVPSAAKRQQHHQQQQQLEQQQLQ